MAECVTPQQICEYCVRGLGADFFFFDVGVSSIGASDSLEEDDEEDSECAESSTGGGVETLSKGCWITNENPCCPLWNIVQWCRPWVQLMLTGHHDVEALMASIPEVLHPAEGLEGVKLDKRHPCSVGVVLPLSVNELAAPTN